MPCVTLPTVDIDFARRFCAVIGVPLKRLFRLRVDGLEHLDRSRPGLLVSNHNTGAWGVLDVLAIYHAWFTEQADPPPLICFGERMVVEAPGIARSARRLGGVVVSVEAMREAMRQGCWLYSTPGAVTDQFRPIWERNRPRIQRPLWLNGRRVLTPQLGFIGVAMEAGYPIYPVAISGTAEMAPVLWESTHLVRWLGILRLRKEELWSGLPLTLNHAVSAALFALTPFGVSPLAWAIFAAAHLYVEPLFMYPVFPFQIRVRIGPPVAVERIPPGAVSPRARHERQTALHAEIVRRMEVLLHELDDTRPWVRAARYLRQGRPTDLQRPGRRPSDVGTV